VSRLRAFVLAAGPGTRLRPLTDRVPKCLVPVGGRPLLAHCLDRLADHGVTDALVNTHHLAGQVAAFVAAAPPRLRVTLVHEPVLLGSAGTLAANRAFTGEDPEFLVAYADTFTTADLSALRAAHRRLGRPVTLGLFRAPVPSACGIAELDAEGRVVAFEEKPARPRSDLAFAGLLVASPALYDAIPARRPCDLGRDVLGRLAGRMAGWDLGAYVRDVGTPEAYAALLADLARGVPGAGGPPAR
jgi:mannose-1-phosphate guanylyltransferase